MATKNSDPAVDAFLLKKGATPIEADLFRVVAAIYASTKAPIQKAQIARRYRKKRHRTMFTFHLRNMVQKGMIKKPSRKFYVPAIS